MVSAARPGIFFFVSSAACNNKKTKIIIIIFFFLRFLSSLQQQQKIITIIFFLHLSNAKHRRVEKYVFLKSREYIFLALEVLHSKPCRSWGSVWDWMPHGEENRSYPFTHAHTDGQFCHACVGTDSWLKPNTNRLYSESNLTKAYILQRLTGANLSWLKHT